MQMHDNAMNSRNPLPDGLEGDVDSVIAYQGSEDDRAEISDESSEFSISRSAASRNRRRSPSPPRVIYIHDAAQVRAVDPPFSAIFFSAFLGSILTIFILMALRTGVQRGIEKLSNIISVLL